jgi:hypothetical protein
VSPPTGKGGSKELETETAHAGGDIQDTADHARRFVFCSDPWRSSFRHTRLIAWQELNAQLGIISRQQREVTVVSEARYGIATRQVARIYLGIGNSTRYRNESPSGLGHLFMLVEFYLKTAVCPTHQLILVE